MVYLPMSYQHQLWKISSASNQRHGLLTTCYELVFYPTYEPPSTDVLRKHGDWGNSIQAEHTRDTGRNLAFKYLGHGCFLVKNIITAMKTL